MCDKRSCAASVAIVLTITVVMLAPVTAIAGSLEPASAPAPTMKTLDQIPPTWSQKLQCDETACPRFELVLNGYGVLDKETGLVWQKQPSAVQRVWYDAMQGCLGTTSGTGRMGWHLPTAEQLMSLVDISTSNPSLPPGSPFILQPNSYYWSATTVPDQISIALAVDFAIGHLVETDKKSSPTKPPYFFAWCVRGGQSYDGG